MKYDNRFHIKKKPKQSNKEILGETTIFSFNAIIALHYYHLYKDTIWSNATMNDEIIAEVKANLKSMAADAYSYAIESKHS